MRRVPNVMERAWTLPRALSVPRFPISPDGQCESDTVQRENGPGWVGLPISTLCALCAGWSANAGSFVRRATLAPRENAEIFHFPRMIKFADFEFIFAFRGSKLGRRGVERK